MQSQQSIPPETFAITLSGALERRFFLLDFRIITNLICRIHCRQ